MTRTCLRTYRRFLVPSLGKVNLNLLIILEAQVETKNVYKKSLLLMTTKQYIAMKKNTTLK